MKLKEINASNFDEEVLNSSVPVLLDFSAEWCGPCKMLTPVLEELAEELGDKAKICSVDVDEEKELALKYQVSSIPLLIFFKNGNEEDKQVGLAGKQALKSKLESLL